MLLIRRYARAMRELQSEAVRARGPRVGAREARAATQEPLIKAAKSLATDAKPPRAPA
jgi:hypothetical protein